MTCPAYPAAVAGLPNDSSEFSAEGTFAHYISDECFLLGTSAHDAIGVRLSFDGHSFEWDDEDADYLQPGIDWVRAQGGQFFGEQRVDLSDLLGPDQFGTLDRGWFNDDVIGVSDLKWGRGVPVQAVGNKQLRLYAWAFWWNIARHHTKATDFVIHIDQPRNSAGGGIWRITLDDLQRFADEARAAAERTRDPNAPRIASADGCYWCRRRKQEPEEEGAVTGCRTYDEFNLSMLAAEFDDLPDLVLPGHNALTAERRAQLIAHTPMIQKWLEQIKAMTLDDALAGRDAGGLKAVAGPAGRRKWKNAVEAEKAVVSLLGDASFSQKLITPTQVGKKISPEDYAKFVADHVERGDPKPILVPVEDDRPAIALADEFDDLD